MRGTESRERKTGATMWQQLQLTRREPRRLLERIQKAGSGTGSGGICHAQFEVFLSIWHFDAWVLTIQMSPCGSKRCWWEDCGWGSAHLREQGHLPGGSRVPHNDNQLIPFWSIGRVQGRHLEPCWYLGPSGYEQLPVWGGMGERTSWGGGEGSQLCSRLAWGIL